MDPPEAAQDLFGRLLVRAGYLSPQALEQVLAQQQQERARGAGRPLGAMLLELGAVRDSQVARCSRAGPQLDSVTLTLLGEPVYLDWRWR